MRFFALFSLLAGVQVQAADLCKEPVKAICQDIKPAGKTFSEEDIRKEVKALLGKSSFGLNAESDDEAYAAYQKYIGAVNTVLMKHFAEKGISEDKIREKIASIQAVLANGFSSGEMGPSLTDTGKASNKGIAENMGKINFISPRKLSEMDPENHWKIGFYYRVCGVDGLLEGASYSDGQFNLCPGFLLRALNAGSLDALDFVAGHELTHSADAGKSIADQNGYQNMRPKYEAFLQCIDRNFSDKMEKTENVAARYRGAGKRDLQKYIDQLKQRPGDHALEILEAENAMDFADTWLSNIVDFYEPTKVREPNLIEAHKSELSADLGGALALTKSLKNVPADQRPLVLASSLHVFCQTRSKPLEILNGNLKDDGVHPPLDFRITNLMRNPELRTLMGCTAPMDNKPWCGISGEPAPVTAKPANGSTPKSEQARP